MERNGTEGLDGPNDDLVIELIREAALAGANRVAAREGALGRGGFLKLARKHRGLAGLLADEVGYRASVTLMLADDSHDGPWDEGVE